MAKTENARAPKAIATVLYAGFCLLTIYSEQKSMIWFAYMFAGMMMTFYRIASSPFFMRNSSERERPYLFSDTVEEVRQVFAGPTAGVQPGRNGSVANLRRMAEQARSSGSRMDMQEYLRVRRSMVG